MQEPMALRAGACRGRDAVWGGREHVVILVRNKGPVATWSGYHVVILVHNRRRAGRWLVAGSSQSPPKLSLAHAMSEMFGPAHLGC